MYNLTVIQHIQIKKKKLQITRYECLSDPTNKVDEWGGSLRTLWLVLSNEFG